MSQKVNSPLVSVIIPAYNVAQYIETSVGSILSQTYKNLEVIVIDDGSTDATYKTLKELAAKDSRLTVAKNQTNLKIVGTLNKAIDMCHGKYVARMDGDDIRERTSIEEQVKYLEENPETVIVGGEIDVCDGNMEIINHRAYPHTDEQIRAKIFRYNPFAHPAVMMRKSVLEHEVYELNWAEDYDLWFRLGNLGKMANLSSTVLQLRTHPSSVSQSKVSYQEYLTLYIRLKAVFEYGYQMSNGDKVYFAVQLISKWLMPVRLRFWLFSKIRGKKK